jgi:hypothetical protein
MAMAIATRTTINATRNTPLRCMLHPGCYIASRPYLAMSTPYLCHAAPLTMI